MKNYILILVFLLFCCTTQAQTLFIEDFSSYALGNFHNDFTGTTPNKGGWYTYDNGHRLSTNADYQIVTDVNQNKYLHIGYTNQRSQFKYEVFRNDLNNILQQRQTGNNILKFSFDIFTKEANAKGGVFFLYNEYVYPIQVAYSARTRTLALHLKQRNGKSGTGVSDLMYDNNVRVVLPVNTWVTIEVYLNWDTSDVAIRIPILNYTNKGSLVHPLLSGGVDNEGNPLPDDRLTKMVFQGEAGINDDPTRKNPYRLQIDNINITAQNTMPAVNTLNTYEHLTNSFNIYPNPASNLVTITNNDNMPVQQITIYDIAGKQLRTHTFNNQTEVQLNVAHLASGTYMLQIHTLKGTAVKQLVKK